MKSIPLTQGKFALVDDGDYDWLNQWKWYAFDNGGIYYAARRGKAGTSEKKTTQMHREIMRVPNGKDVDHKNGDGLDNRRSNLRICTHAENCRNSKRYKATKSGYRGVTRVLRKFYASICVNGRKIRLGIFSSPVEAARAYDMGAKKYHGNFAKLNFPT